MKDLIQTFLYWLSVKTWVRGILAWCVRKDVRGLENIPRKGPVIMVSNHLSNGDPPVLTGVMTRRIVWFAKKELFDTPLVGWLYGLHGMIPVRRGEADLNALRMATKALKDGHLLGMFPEGTRSRGQGLKEGEHGTALLAIRSGAPLLPVAIWGTENVKLPRDMFLFRKTKATVRIGPTFQLLQTKRATKEQIAAGTREIMETIAGMLPEHFRGVYAARAAATASAKKGN